MNKQKKNLKIKFIPKSSEEGDLRIFKALSLILSVEDLKKFLQVDIVKSGSRELTKEGEKG